MERIDFINTARIKWCCDEVGIDLEQLSKKTGISLQTLKKLFDNEGSLTFNQLKKLADFFGRGVFFFLEEGEISEEKVHTANFRTLTNQKPHLSLEMRKFIERVEKKRNEYLWLIEDLEGELPDFQLPILHGNIEEKAIQIREWLELPDKNSFETYREAIERKGIFVLLSQGYRGKWKIPNESLILGFSLWHKKMPVIFIRKEQTQERQTFTLIHELAHLILHHTSRIDDENDLFTQKTGIESEANRFAGSLLVPAKFLDEINVNSIPRNFEEYSEWFKYFRNRWGVSTEVILRRLVDAGKYDPALYKAYREWLNNRHHTGNKTGGHRYRDREPLHIFGKHYVQRVLDAKNSEIITLYKASQYLDDIKIKHLHQLEGYLVGNG